MRAHEGGVESSVQKQDQSIVLTSFFAVLLLLLPLLYDNRSRQRPAILYLRYGQCCLYLSWVSASYLDPGSHAVNIFSNLLGSTLGCDMYSADGVWWY